MIGFAWYIGIVGNSVLSLILLLSSLVLLIVFTQNNKKEKEIFWFSLALLSFVFILISIDFLYIESFIYKNKISELNPFFPQIMWFGNLLFFGFIYLMAVNSAHIKKSYQIYPFFCYLIFGILNGVSGLASYIVFWNDGNVLVYYTNKTAELVNSILNILIIVLGFYLVSETIFNRKHIQTHQLDIIRLILISFGLIFGLLIFLVPRTNSWSITDSVNVKIVFYIIFSIFISILMTAFLFNKKIMTLLKKVSQNDNYIKFKTTNIKILYKFKPFNKSLQIIVLVSLFLFFFLLLFWKAIEPMIIIYEYADDAVKDGIAFFIGEFFHIKWYIHLIGAVFPFIVACLLLITIFKFKNSTNLFLFFLTIFFSQMLCSILFNNILNLSTRTTYFVPFILAFVFPIFFAIFFNFILFFKTFDNPEFRISTLVSNLVNISLLLPIYSATVFSAIFTDFMNPKSSTGKILVGGGSFVDGILLIPIFNSILALIMTIITIFILLEFIKEEKQTI